MNDFILDDMCDVYNRNKKLWEELRGKTIMITGAYGMLASYMVYLLIYLNEYHSYDIKIIAVCRNKEKLRKRFLYYIDKKYFSTILCELHDSIKYNGNIDYIIHAASLASSQYYNTNPVDVILPNSIGTYYLLELSRKCNCKGFLFFSSGEIYGELKKPIIDEIDSGYLNPTDIRSCYGESKRLGETLCTSWAHQYNQKITIVRPSHTYGPTMDLKNDQRVFSEFVSNVVSHKNIIMKSNGDSSRNFCYLADAMYAYYLVLFNGVSGEAYNVSNMEGKCSIRDLAITLCGLYPEFGLSVITAKHDFNYLENKNKIQYMLNTKKLEKLGWKPKYDIKTGFKRTIDSFLKSSAV